ncbi:MAG: hemolysin family protein [Aggregatilineales bacterium]
MEILIIFLLTLLNGVLAMSELAVVSARQARLQAQRDDDTAGAKAALELAQDPNRFLSTVQIGISLIGVLAGAFSGATLTDDMARLLAQVDFLAPYSDPLGFALVVAFTTYLSLIFGELVPKRLALRSPERIAIWVARPMRLLSRLAYPLVVILSISTQVILRLLNAHEDDAPTVTEEEIQIMLNQGIKDGIFDASEQEMIAGVFRLDDLRVSALMTPRTEMVWIDVDDPLEEILQIINDHDHRLYPVIDGTPDEVIGIVKMRDILRFTVKGELFTLRQLIKPPLFIPEGITADVALSRFRRERQHVALILGEHGGVEGLLTRDDILEAIVGDLGTPEAIQRKDGTWLIDGLMPVAEFKALFDLREDMPDESEGLYQTLGGFFLHQFGDIPKPADRVEWHGLIFEVMDMDDKRIDKLLVSNADKA